jgi:hypothetical protein
MDQWEYKYIALYRGNHEHRGYSAPNVLPEFQSELAEAGKQGWEAVGSSIISYNDIKGVYISHPVLILKRRLR